MSSEYWNTLKQRLNEFWQPGQEIICLRIFKEENSQCELCDHQPITWNHVLINLQTRETLNVGSRCVENSKKYLDSKAKFLLFDKYHKSVNGENQRQVSKSEIINLNETVAVLDKVLADQNLKYKTLKPILKFTSELKSGYGDYLYQRAMDIFIENKYYLIESSGLMEKEYNDPKIWEEYCLRDTLRDWEEHLANEALSEDAEYASDYNSDDEHYVATDDDSPEGLGLDEIDWDSNDINER